MRIVAAALWAGLGFVMVILVPGWPPAFSLAMVIEAHLIFLGGKIGLGAAVLGALAFGLWVGFVLVVTLFTGPTGSATGTRGSSRPSQRGLSS
jgi:hypothetical protein